MEALVKIDLDKQINSGEKIKIDIGCGHKKRDGFIGIDKLEMPGVDIVANFDQGMAFLPDNSVDEIYSKSVFEHIDNLELMMSECVRVLKPGGKAWIFVPHWSNPYFYQDYTHIRFFGLYTFFQFVDEKYQLKQRQVPCFYQDTRIRITSIKLIFKSNFKLVRPFRKLMTYIVNSSDFMKAFYEENFTYVVPCYGIEVEFTPVK